MRGSLPLWCAVFVGAAVVTGWARPAQSGAERQEPFEVKGTVVDTSGRPAPAVRVCGYPIERGPSSVASCGAARGDGTFRVAIDLPGRYVVMADDVGNGHVPPIMPFFRAPAVPAVEVVVAANAASHTVSLVLAPANEVLKLDVADAGSGRPVEVIRAILCHADQPTVCRFADVRDSAGAFETPVSHVPYTLRVWARGYDDWYGLRGADRDTVLTPSAGTVRTVAIRLRRSASVGDNPIDEEDKRPDVDLPPPSPLAPIDDALVDYVEGRVMRLIWQPVPGAVRYGVEVDYCVPRRGSPCAVTVPFYREDMLDIRTTEYQFRFIGAQPGRWRVWAVDARGRDGFKSRWQAFRHAR